MKPQDWITVPLRDVARFSGGTTPSRARQADYYDHGIHLWVKTMDLNNWRIWSTSESVTDKAIKETSLKIHPAGTVLVAMYGGFQQIGRTGILGHRAAVNQAITAIYPDHRKLVPDYLLHTLNFHVDYWKTVASSSRKDPNITSGDVKEFPLSLPPARQEQAAIANALNDIEVLIATLERLITKKQAIKQGILQKLITGKTRLPGYETAWNSSRLGDLLQRPPRYGINAPAVPIAVDTHNYIRITDIDDSGRFAPQPKVGVRDQNASNYLLHEGELVFARTGASVGKSYLYDSKDGILVYAGFLINIAPDPQILDPEYLSYFAQTKQYWDWVARTSVRSGQPGINGREYAQLEISCPDVREQRAIAAAVRDASHEIRALNDRLDKARSIKQGMMQELLTGRTRLTS